MRQHRLDLALLFSRRGDLIELPSTRVGSVPMVWVMKKDAPLRGSLNLVLFEPPCVFREVATEILAKANRSWRQVFVSPSLAGTWAAVELGLGLSLRTRIGLPGNLTTQPRLPGTRRLPLVDITVLQHPLAATSVVSRLRDLLVQSLRERL